MSDAGLRINLAKLDAESLTSLQKDLHIPKDADEEVSSLFIHQAKKSTWYSLMSIKTNATEKGNKYAYEVNQEFDRLLYSYLNIDIPSVTVKEEYQNEIKVAWTHNLGYNYVATGVVNSKENTLCNINSRWKDQNKQFFRKQDPKFIDKCIGNTDELTSWNTKLPADVLTVRIPWSFSREPSGSLPIYLFRDSGAVTQLFKFRKFNKLLRMCRIDADGNLTTIPYDASYVIFQYNDGVSPTPQLWNKYAYLSDKEREWNACKLEKIYYLDDIVPIRGKFSQGVANVLLTSDLPCKSMYWVTEAIEDIKENKRSHYSMLLDNGREPSYVKDVTLSFGTRDRFTRVPSEHFENIESEHTDTAPFEGGYAAYSFCNDHKSIDPEVGVVFNNRDAKLILRLRKGLSDEYKYTVHLLITKKLTFTRAEGKAEGKWDYVIHDPALEKK